MSSESIPIMALLICLGVAMAFLAVCIIRAFARDALRRREFRRNVRKIMEAVDE